MPTVRRRSARWAYDSAITDFSDASEVLYVRATSGTLATHEELARYANAKVRLEDAKMRVEIERWGNEEALWF
jgi:hypothetical protein